MNWIKNKINEIAVIAAFVILSLQFFVGNILDFLFGCLIIGIFYLTKKVK